MGGGYAGFYTAWKLEKKLRTDEASVTLVDPRPYMTYQPFLPEVTAGSIEARHVAVSLRRHLPRTHLIVGSVVHIDHAHRTATVRPADGPEQEQPYDTIVITAGAVTRTFPIPGIADDAIGLKHVEEAVATRDRLLTAFEQAATLPPGPERRKLLTVTVVGGGFTGVEGFGEMLSLATTLLNRYPELTADELGFHLVEARDRILPEVTAEPARWVVRHLEKRGARVHLGTSLVSAENDHIVLSDGTEDDNHLLVWVAGNQSNPVVARHTDLPVDRAGLFRVRADLRIGSPDAAIPDAWAAGDNAALPDLASDIPGGSFTVPNAQHAVRQGKRLAKNIVADLRGRKAKPYKHHSLGTVATLGLGKGGSSSTAGSSSRACSPGSCTAVTTCWRSRHGSARCGWHSSGRRRWSTVATSCRCCRCSTCEPPSSPPASAPVSGGRPASPPRPCPRPHSRPPRIPHTAREGPGD